MTHLYSVQSSSILETLLVVTRPRGMTTRVLTRESQLPSREL